MSRSQTSSPINSRPFCSNCGEHRWSFDGKCLSRACWPSFGEANLSLQAMVERKKQMKELPAWVKTRPRTARQKRQAEEWCKQMGKEYPWGVTNDG